LSQLFRITSKIISEELIADDFHQSIPESYQPVLALTR